VCVSECEERERDMLSVRLSFVVKWCLQHTPKPMHQAAERDTLLPFFSHTSKRIV
jgi:hypothetical protein